MKSKDFDLSIRVDTQFPSISSPIYAIGILDVIDFLVVDLTEQLKEENRCFGIVKSYLKSINDAYSKIYPNITEDDIEVYGKILYLLKPLLRKEYKRLVNKKLSPADSIICIIRKLLNIIEEVPEFIYKKELGTIKKVIDRLYDNIRNRSKKDSLFNLANTIRTFMSEGKIGKHCLDKFTIKDIEVKKEPLSGNSTRFTTGDENKILEVDIM
jgi:hypothetical protein